ncbi:MAG: TetR/AcrR family transcriptional regulator [Chloroflexi bacterium]|nr:TetR/AcrR family transcriptional regulator [Chloroflexota bacterium]
MPDRIQQQLIEARKNQILDAAAVVFAAKGFHPTTTKDIARQAEIAEGTIYNYFDNKTAILLGIFERMKASVVAQAAPPAADVHDVREFLHTFLYHPLMALKADNFALFRIVVSEMMVNEELRRRYYEQILAPTLALAEASIQEQAASQGRSPANLKLTIRVISGMIWGLMLEHIMGDSVVAERWDELPDFLADLLLNGLTDDKI